MTAPAVIGKIPLMATRESSLFDNDTPAPAARTSPERRAVPWLLGLWTLVNLVYIHSSGLGLGGDEAQYWDWARHLDWDYYSKPPMIAYIIAALTRLGGHTEPAIRTGAVLFSTGALWLLYALTRRIARNDRAAFLAVGLALAMPATWAGSVLMTVDAPLIFFWTLAMYAFHRAVAGNRAMWLLAGVALGLGALTKYTIFLLLIAFVLYLVLVDRRWLRTPWPYIALAIIAVSLSGVLCWTARHDWITFRHMAAIGAGGSASPLKAIDRLCQFIGGQLGVASPILFIFFLWAIAALRRRMSQNRDAAYLFLCFITLFGFYTIVSLARKPLPNWPVAAYMAAIPALAWQWEAQPRTRTAKRWLTAAILIGCALGVATRASDLLYLAAAPFTGPGSSPDRIHLGPVSINPDKDPTNEFQGGRLLGRAISRHMRPDIQGRPPFIFSTRYQMTATAAFYTHGFPQTYCLFYDRRMNQYDLWGGWDALKGRDALFVIGGDAEKARAYIGGMVDAAMFRKGQLLEVVDIYRCKTLVRSFCIIRLYDYSGLTVTPSDRAY